MKRKPSQKKTKAADNNADPNMLTFGGHLEVLRRMLFRIIAVVMVLAIAIFCFKDKTFELLLAPSQWDFVTYRYIEKFLHHIGIGFQFNEFHINMIATELSSQFMTHISTALYLALLGASPYILVELFRFITPALYEKLVKDMGETGNKFQGWWTACRRSTNGNRLKTATGKSILRQTKYFL